MKTIHFFLALFLLTSTFQLSAQSDEVIFARIDKTLKAFENYDAAAFASNFVEHPWVINPLGMIFKSKKEIYEVHKPLFESWGTPPTATSTISNKEIKYLSKSRAIVSFIEEAAGDPKAGEGKLIYSLILDKTGTDWLISFAQITPVVDRSMPNK